MKSLLTDSPLPRMEVASCPKSMTEAVCFVARPPTEEDSPMRSSTLPTATCECHETASAGGGGTRQLRKFPMDELSRSLSATGHREVSNQKMDSVQCHDMCWEVHQHKMRQKLLEDDDTAQVAVQRGMTGRESLSTTGVSDNTCVWYLCLLGRCQVTLSHVRKLWRALLQSVVLLCGSMMSRGPSTNKWGTVSCADRLHREGSQQCGCASEQFTPTSRYA